MKDLKVLTALLDRIRSDYQFDPKDEDYMGFLNVCPSEDWTVEEYETFKWFLENKPAVFENALDERALDIEGFGPDEVIFILTEDPFGDTEEDEDFDWQGRSPEKVQQMEETVMASITGILTLILIYVIYKSLTF